MSPIRLSPVTSQPTAVEAELASLIGNAAQSELAHAAGLTNHARISKGLALVSGGQCDGYAEAFSFAKGLRWAKAHAPLANAVRKYLDGDEVESEDAVSALRGEISADAEMIGKVNAALADGKLTRTERARIALELRKAIERQTRAIRALEKA